jgi:hypothetical protein
MSAGLHRICCCSSSDPNPWPATTQIMTWAEVGTERNACPCCLNVTQVYDYPDASALVFEVNIRRQHCVNGQYSYDPWVLPDGQPCSRDVTAYFSVGFAIHVPNLGRPAVMSFTASGQHSWCAYKNFYSPLTSWEKTLYGFSYTKTPSSLGSGDYVATPQPDRCTVFGPIEYGHQYAYPEGWVYDHDMAWRFYHQNSYYGAPQMPDLKWTVIVSLALT